MNTLFGDLAKRVAAFDPYKEAIKAAIPAKAEIIDYNVEDQLYELGIDNRNKSIGDYEPYTKERKQLKRDLGIGDGRISNVTLRDEGEFHKSFDVEFRDNEFEIVAHDPKTEKLQENWGEEILGLTDQNLQKVKDDYIRPNMQAAFRAKILI